MSCRFPSARPFLWAALVGVTSACAPTGAGGGRDAGVDGGPAADAGLADDAGPAAPDALALLDEVDALALLAGANGGVKYLAPVEGAAPRAPLEDACAFQNTARYPYHLEYLRAQPGGEGLTYQDYLALVLRRQTRVWWGGEVRLRPEAEHPLTNAPGVLAYTLYTEDSPGNRLTADDVRAVFAALTACAPAFDDALAFTPSSNEQRITAASIRETLAEEGIAVLLD